MFEDDASPGVAGVVQHQANLLLRTLVEAQTTDADATDALDPTLSIDALLSVVAGILESLPGLATERELRIATDDTAEQLKTCVQEMRVHFARTGRHGMAMIGAKLENPAAAPSRAH